MKTFEDSVFRTIIIIIIYGNVVEIIADLYYIDGGTKK